MQKTTLSGAAVGTAAALVAGPARAKRHSAAEIRDLLQPLPADRQTGQDVCRKLLDGGEETIVELVAMIGEEFGDSDGVKPKYALHGLAHHASRPDADDDRKLLARTLAGQLQADHSSDLKAFLVRQLQLCGREEEVPALAALLADERLRSPAAEALAAIGGKSAQAALKGA